MIEAPEALFLSEQLNQTIIEKTISDVFARGESYLEGSIYYCSGCQIFPHS